MTTKTTSLLVVDDDPVFSMFIRQLVLSLENELSCKVTCVESAEAALPEIHKGRFDLTLLDYHLPGMDGLGLLAQISAMPVEKQPAVVMLTGSGNESVAVEAMKRGAKDYLQKNDVDAPSLMRAVQSALTQKRLAEQVASYNAIMNADLAMARKLQDSLLPHSYPSFPSTVPPDQSALRFEHRYFWAAQLGGDFFSVQELSDGRAGVLICDVMGHGVRAAMVTAMLRAMVGDLESHASEPGTFLSEMNHKLAVILKQIEEPLYATAFYLIADVPTGRVQFAKAGHPAPLHVKRAAGKVAPLALPHAAGAALGLFERNTYVAGECHLAPGDVILLFTDGLFEVANADDEDYGADRLKTSVRERMHQPLPQLLDGIIADIRQFTDGVELEDDVCLLGMEVAGNGNWGYNSPETKVAA